MKSSLLLAALCLTLTGCATNGGKVWYNPDKTSEEVKHDMMECRYDAEKYSTGAGAGYETGIGSGIAIGLKQVSLMKQCMALKGYTLVDQSELPVGRPVFKLDY